MSGSDDKATRAVGSEKRVPKSPERPVEVPTTAPAPGGPKTILTEGEIVENRFRLTKLLGAGGQGEVWRAEDLEISGHVVALKLLFDRARTPEQKEMLLRELRMLASVSHPAVVQFKEHGWLHGRLWFVMPFLAGKSLEEQMPITRSEARRVFETLAGGLSAVHAKGLRHQDIKPSNIFLAEVDGLDHPMPMLLDFGVAAREGETLVAGSPDYFAPELAAGWPAPTDITPAADVFSLALSLRNALEPETAPTLDAFSPESLKKRGAEPIDPPTGRSLRFLAPHFARWLSPDPSRRPTASELAAELQVLTAPEDGAAERRKTLRRVAPAVAIAALVIGVGGWWGWGQLVEARKATVAEEAEAEEARRRAEEASSRAEDLGTRLGDALDRADEAASRTEAAIARLNAAEDEIDRAEGSAEALRAARDRLRAALADATTEIASQSEALAETRATVAHLTSELDGTRADLASTRTELTTARADLEARAATLATVRADLASMTSERDARSAELDTARARITELEGRVAAAEASAASAGDAANARAATAEARVTELEGRVAELEGTVRSLRRELEDARSGGGGGGTVTPVEGAEPGPAPSLPVP